MKCYDQTGEWFTMLPPWEESGLTMPCMDFDGCTRPAKHDGPHNLKPVEPYEIAPYLEALTIPAGTLKVGDVLRITLPGKPKR